ncbi:uncharacterized protein C8Q71DRAFT_425448 [Rhodofomes roseus]|uniref:Uncharacterized protein n=1 Tax=Rhodofomes roseus TaxID=34475 RepID=A0ABQ8KSC0_9APHY|nr:uncharacterized protein C8Q71DRAFT_425448 [Rhodofomes roseus]KAH9840834.1 hypothetical protein C8Q71DRAFT_425448 [Rhodofomes roseus]
MMIAFKLSALAGLAVLGVSAVPKDVQPRATTTRDPACPFVTTQTFVETLSIIAPTTTGPFETTTLTETLISWPIAATTMTEVGEDGNSYTVTWTYSNWENSPPYPSDCHFTYP